MNRAIDRLEDDRFAARILGRDLVSLPPEHLRQAIAGKAVLVTGAGGYIGAALVRLLAGLGPARIVLADNSEHALYEIDRALRAIAPALPVYPVICDIRDSTALARLFAVHGPEIVFHAAALKHLPLTEANPREAVLTNVIGTANLAACCQSAGAGALIHISTDKAAAPTSMLGMTKRLAELVCQAGDRAGGPARCSSVRFNNVFGSTGSVVPLFLDQIARGRKLTITHPAMNRYFVTASEATQLVLAVLGMSLSADAAERAVYVLEAGARMAIVDLGRRMLVDAGLADAGLADEEWVTIGMRHGEKLDENLIAPWETRGQTASPLVSLACGHAMPDQALQDLLAELRQACDAFDEARLRRLLGAATGAPLGAQSAVSGLVAA